MGTNRPRKSGPRKGEKPTNSTENLDRKEKTSQATGSWISVFRRHRYRYAETSGTDADRQETLARASTLGSIFSGLKHPGTGTSDIDQESEGKQAANSASVSSGQRTNDSMT
jgi:hypothetical protein